MLFCWLDLFLEMVKWQRPCYRFEVFICSGFLNENTDWYQTDFKFQQTKCLYHLQSPILHSSKVDDEVMNDCLLKLGVIITKFVLTITTIKRSDTKTMWKIGCICWCKRTPNSKTRWWHCPGLGLLFFGGNWDFSEGGGSLLVPARKQTLKLSSFTVTMIQSTHPNQQNNDFS